MKKINIIIRNIIIGLSIVVGISIGGTSDVHATSADISFSSSFDGSRYTYYLDVTNTSDPGFDIYYIMFGHQVGVPFERTFIDTSPVSSPSFWTIDTDAGVNVIWNADPYGYIPAGTSLDGFAFSSITPPPSNNVPFAVGFYDNNNHWGFNFNGTATYMGVVPEPISTVLFITGGATLGFRHLRRKKK